jgi:hypothetical protein
MGVSSFALVVTPPHGRAVAFGHIGAWICRTIAAQVAVARDLRGGQQGWRFQMSRKTDETQFCARGGSTIDQVTRRFRPNVVIADVVNRCAAASPRQPFIYRAAFLST